MTYGREPAVYNAGVGGALGALIVAVAGQFGVELSTEMASAIVGGIGLLAGLVTRSQVSPAK